jgi:hypothetical protein
MVTGKFVKEPGFGIAIEATKIQKRGIDGLISSITERLGDQN